MHGSISPEDNITEELFARFGVYSIDLSINAGLDLEMPGTNKWRTLDLMNRSIGSRKLMVRTIKERAKKVVELAKRVARESPEVTPPTHIYSVY